MSNISYCRFRNTLHDIRECQENMDGGDHSQDEEIARRSIIEICVEIALNYGGEIDRVLEEV